MARPKNVIPRTHIEVALDQPTLGKVQLELFDATKARVPRGALSDLINVLLREWLQKRGIQ